MVSVYMTSQGVNCAAMPKRDSNCCLSTSSSIAPISATFARPCSSSQLTRSVGSSCSSTRSAVISCGLVWPASGSTEEESIGSSAPAGPRHAPAPIVSPGRQPLRPTAAHSSPACARGTEV